MLTCMVRAPRAISSRFTTTSSLLPHCSDPRNTKRPVRSRLLAAVSRRRVCSGDVNRTTTFDPAIATNSYNRMKRVLNHFSTTGRCSGPAHYDVSIRQAARAAFVTSSFKIFSTQTFPRCGATCYILPSRAMTQLFNGVHCVSLRGSLLNILQLFASFSQNPILLQWRTVLTTLAICRVMF